MERSNDARFASSLTAATSGRLLSDGTATNDPDPERTKAALAATLEMIESLFGYVLTLGEVLLKIENGRRE